MTFDFYSMVADKFYRWALQWVKPDENKTIRDFPIQVIIAKLIYGCIFTEEELRLEMKKCKIPLHETFYIKAQQILEEMRID